MRWLTLTHTQRWHAHRHNAGTGHVYQGRFKSFPVQEDSHFLTVARYIEPTPCGPNVSSMPRIGNGQACMPGNTGRP
jgi:putative transposase